jgi:hypothetical protein
MIVNIGTALPASHTATVNIGMIVQMAAGVAIVKIASAKKATTGAAARGMVHAITVMTVSVYVLQYTILAVSPALTIVENPTMSMLMYPVVCLPAAQ